MVNHKFFTSLVSSKIYSFSVVVRDGKGKVFYRFRTSLSGKDVNSYFLTLLDAYPSFFRIRVYLVPSFQTVLHL